MTGSAGAAIRGLWAGCMVLTSEQASSGGHRWGHADPYSFPATPYCLGGEAGWVRCCGRAEAVVVGRIGQAQTCGAPRASTSPENRSRKTCKTARRSLKIIGPQDGARRPGQKLPHAAVRGDPGWDPPAAQHGQCQAVCAVKDHRREDEAHQTEEMAQMRDLDTTADCISFGAMALSLSCAACLLL